MNPNLHKKYAHLTLELQKLEKVIIAFSGGVDSTALVAAAVDILGKDKVLAVTSGSESMPRRELDETVRLAAEIGVTHLLIQTQEFENPDYVKNDLNRCFFCKQTLFTDLLQISEKEGYKHVLFGAILDDLGDYRPGMQAARQLGIRGPLAEAQMNKEDVRELAKHFNLSVWDKPASACLSSRVVRGQQVTVETIQKIEHAEDFLKDLGFRQVRVRHHDQDHARVEVESHEIARAASRGAEISSFLKGLGYRFVSLDLEGYRTGSLNPVSTS